MEIKKQILKNYVEMYNLINLWFRTTHQKPSRLVTNFCKNSSHVCSLIHTKTHSAKQTRRES